MATIITFLISAMAHELVMACITKKVRGFGFIAQMMQLPIVVVQRTKWVKGRRVFNVSMRLVLQSLASQRFRR
jgi:sterol O-acyltransferase